MQYISSKTDVVSLLRLLPAIYMYWHYVLGEIFSICIAMVSKLSVANKLCVGGHDYTEDGQTIKYIKEMLNVFLQFLHLIMLEQTFWLFLQR